MSTKVSVGIGRAAARGGSTSSIRAKKAGRAVERLQAHSMQWVTRWPCPEASSDVDPEITSVTTVREEISARAIACQSWGWGPVAMTDRMP